MILQWLIESDKCEICKVDKGTGRILCLTCWRKMKDLFPKEYKLYMEHAVAEKRTDTSDSTFFNRIYTYILQKNLAPSD